MKFKKLNYIVIILTTILLLGYVFFVDNPKSLLSALLSAKPMWLIYALLSILFYWLLDCFVLRSLCNRISNKLSLVEGFRATMTGQLFNCITPFASGGQPMQAYVLSKNNIPLGEASSILLAKFIVYQITLTFYSCIVILLKLKFFLNQISGFGYLVLLGFSVNIIVVALLIGIGFFPKTTKNVLISIASFLYKIKLLKKYEKTCKRITEELDNFYVNFTLLKGDLKLLIFPTFLTILQLTAFFMIPFFVCLSLGVPNPGLLTMICAAAFVLLISSFIPSPGGSGVAEGSFYMFFNIFFSQAGLLAVAILLWRLFTFYLPIIVGIFMSAFSKAPVASE